MGNLDDAPTLAGLGEPDQAKSRSASRSPRGALWTIALTATIFVLGVLAADSAVAKSWGYDLAAELMSPYCPGRTLASCPSPQAAELVQWMVLQEAAGSTQEEVIAVLIDRFGEEILAAPPAKGITLWAYIFPILGFVVGGGFVVVAMRRIVSREVQGEAGGVGTAVVSTMSSINAAAPASAAQSGSGMLTDDELARRVDADLAARG